MEFEIACTEDAYTCTYILCGSLGLAVLCSWGTCSSSHVYMYFFSHSILFCGHPHLEISSLHLQVHSTPEPLRWRGETRRRFFSWCGAVLPIRWESKLCWHHVYCWVTEHRHLCIQYRYCWRSLSGWVAVTVHICMLMFIISALMWLHPQPSLLSCRGCVWHSVCISLLYKAMECGTWCRYDEEHFQVSICVCTCIENQSKHMYIYLHTPHHGHLGCPTLLSNQDCIDFRHSL